MEAGLRPRRPRSSISCMADSRSRARKQAAAAEWREMAFSRPISAESRERIASQETAASAGYTAAGSQMALESVEPHS
jgi:hypothetical protein